MKPRVASRPTRTFPASLRAMSDPVLRADSAARVSVAVSTLGRGSGNGAAVPSPSTLRRAILVNLRRGPMSPDGLAHHLGASRTGVLQQLRALEEAGLVDHSVERHGVGRPRHLYDVTPDAQDLFPADYDGFAAALLDAIVAVGGADLVEEVFAARRRQMGARLRKRLDARLAPGASLADRVRGLAVIQDEAGYLAEATVSAADDPSPGAQLRDLPPRPRGGLVLRGGAGAVRRGAGNERRAGDAHRGGRPILHLPRRARRGG